MEDIKERIQAIYNDCWKNYKCYLSDHDMESYNQRSLELTKKYGCADDIKGLLFWFGSKVQALHDGYVRMNQGKVKR